MEVERSYSAQLTEFLPTGGGLHVVLAAPQPLVACSIIPYTRVNACPPLGEYLASVASKARACGGTATSP